MEGLAPISVDRNDPVTLRRGVAKRLGRSLPTPQPGAMRGLASFVRQWLEDNIDPVVVPTFEEWLDATTYPECRKEELRRAAELDRYGRPPREYSRKIQSFIKAESYDEFKECRWINSRHDRFKAYSGRFFSAIEKEVFKNEWFIKHVPVAERPAKILSLEKAGLRYYENDYKAYECHFTKEVMRAVECQLYSYALAAYPTDAAYINSVLSGENRLKSQKHKFRVRLNARRMSGDMCTSLGNGFTNLMIVLYIAQQKGYKPTDCSGFVEGDDGLFAVPFSMDATDFTSLGFTVEIKEVAHPYEAHFCGMRMSPDGTILKDPIKFFSKFGWTDSCIHGGESVMMSLLQAKALSAIYELPQCPIIGAAARRCLQVSAGHRPRFADTYKATPAQFDIQEFAPSPV